MLEMLQKMNIGKMSQVRRSTNRSDWQDDTVRLEIFRWVTRGTHNC